MTETIVTTHNKLKHFKLKTFWKFSSNLIQVYWFLLSWGTKEIPRSSSLAFVTATRPKAAFVLQMCPKRIWKRLPSNLDNEFWTHQTNISEKKVLNFLFSMKQMFYPRRSL